MLMLTRRSRGTSPIRWRLVGTGLATLATVACLVLAGPAPALGAARWSAQKLPRGIASLGQIACPRKSSCFATAGTTTRRLAVIATTNGGKVWTIQLLPRSATGATASVIACPTRRECFVAGGVGPQDGEMVKVNYGLIWKTTNAGHTWSTVRLPASTPELTAISCPSSSTCYAIGNFRREGPTTTLFTAVAVVTNNGGRSWSRELPGDRSSNTLTVALSCPARTVCQVLALTTLGAYPAEMLSTSNSGATWHAKSLPRLFPTEDEATFSIDCASTRTCMTSGGNFGRFAVTTDGGAHWTLRSVPNVFVETLSCPNTSRCWAAGVPWSWERTLQRPPNPYTRFVVAQGNGLGTKWKVRTLPGSPVRLPGNVSMSCPGKATCWVASSHPAALYALR